MDFHSLLFKAKFLMITKMPKSSLTNLTLTNSYYQHPSTHIVMSSYTVQCSNYYALGLFKDFITSSHVQLHIVSHVVLVKTHDNYTFTNINTYKLFLHHTL